MIRALIVSPLRPGEYVLAKALTLAALGVVESIAIIGLGFGFGLRWGWLVLGALSLSVIYALLGLVAVARYEAINAFLMPSVGYLTVLVLPLLGYYGIVPWWVFAPHPVMPPLVLLEAGCQPVATGQVAYGVLGSLAWCGIAFAWVRRRLVRDIVPTTV